MKSELRHFFDSGLRLLRAGLLYGFDSVVLLANPKKNDRREGAIFCLHGLGDLLLAGNAVTRLATEMRAQQLRAVLFVHPAWIEFARRHFAVDEVEGIDRHLFTRRLGYRAKVLKMVSGRFTQAVQPTFNRMLRVEDCLMRATGAPKKTGNSGHAPFIWPKERWLGDRFYTRLIQPQTGLKHELERYAEFMAGLDLKISTEPWRIKSVATPAANPMVPRGSYLVLAPRATDTRRSWGLENFLRVAERVARQRGLAIVIVGHEKSPLPRDWMEAAGEKLEVIDLGGKIRMEDLPELLAGADLILSNDSGVYHLGISLDRPTVAVGGSGIPARYFPYPHESSLPTKMLYRPVTCGGCNWRCIHTPSRTETAWCLQQVGWEEMANAADKLLAQVS